MSPARWPLLESSPSTQPWSPSKRRETSPLLSPHHTHVHQTPAIEREREECLWGPAHTNCGCLGDDVVSGPRPQDGDGNHLRVDGVAFARHQGLQTAAAPASAFPFLPSGCMEGALNLVTIAAAARMGSTVRCGWAACPPLPPTVMLNRPEAAITTPDRLPSSPDSRVGDTWRAKIASTPSIAPSSNIFSPPAPPSSAGWKSSRT